MPKTDKELATEIVCSYIYSWGTQNNCQPVRQEQLSSLIEDVYYTISQLDKENN